MTGHSTREVLAAGQDTELVFADVYQTYRQPIYNYLLGMTQNPTEAEDLTQEAFIRVDRGLSSFRGEASLSTWLYRIARNIFIDHTRRSSTRQSRDAVPLEEQRLVTETARTPERSASRTEMSECVQRTIQGLPESYRTVLVLRDLRGLKNQEVADILDCSLDTVKIRLHRARAKLRGALDIACDFSYDEYNVFGCEPKAGFSMDCDT